jgi:hypothetical protein
MGLIDPEAAAAWRKAGYPATSLDMAVQDLALVDMAHMSHLDEVIRLVRSGKSVASSPEVQAWRRARAHALQVVDRLRAEPPKTVADALARGRRLQTFGVSRRLERTACKRAARRVTRTPRLRAGSRRASRTGPDREPEPHHHVVPAVAA